MKSAALIESFAVQLGIELRTVRAIDYRIKDERRPANWYRAHLDLAGGGSAEQDWWHLADGDWGAGFLQNPACDWCDDVVAETADVRAGVRSVLWETGKLCSAKSEKLAEGQGLDYKDYFQFTESARQIPPHRILAINRGEKEEALKVKVEYDVNRLKQASAATVPLEGHPHRELLETVVEDALNRMRPIFNVNQPAQEAALASLHETETVARRIAHTRAGREPHFRNHGRQRRQ